MVSVGKVYWLLKLDSTVDIGLAKVLTILWTLHVTSDILSFFFAANTCVHCWSKEQDMMPQIGRE